MENWKYRLYEGYISTGQAPMHVTHGEKLDVANYPYYQKIIDKYLPSNKEITIVDLACGHGSLVYCLKEMGYDHTKGVDVSPEQVALAHRFGLTEVECSTMHDFLEARYDLFDVVFMMDILEHLTRGEFFDLLDKVYSSIREKGMLIAHVPNGEGLFGMRVRYGDMTHETCFTQRSISQGLRAVGFKKIEVIEDQPIAHDLKGLVRNLLWRILTIIPRFLLMIEVGTEGAKKPILSQNMLVIAQK